jgi:hypothetical protein
MLSIRIYQPPLGVQAQLAVLCRRVPDVHRHPGSISGRHGSRGISVPR